MTLMDVKDLDKRAAAVNLARNGAVAVLLKMKLGAHVAVLTGQRSRCLIHQILDAVIRKGM